MIRGEVKNCAEVFNVIFHIGFHLFACEQIWDKHHIRHCWIKKCSAKWSLGCKQIAESHTIHSRFQLGVIVF